MSGIKERGRGEFAAPFVIKIVGSINYDINVLCACSIHLTSYTGTTKI